MRKEISDQLSNSETIGWTEVISSRSNWFDLKLDEVWRYRDLLAMFVKRDFIATYKQTILGPLWFLIQPLITIITYSIVFGYILNIAVGEVPRVLFYLAGLTMWSYFSECMKKTGSAFISNAKIFGKVYFPRLILPFSIIISGGIRLGIQFALFLGVMLVYYLKGEQFVPTIYALLSPVLVLIVAGLGLGVGIIVSALTTKYRDLLYLVQFSVQLLMYATPVIYPLSMASGVVRTLLLLNPMTSIVEAFRYAWLGPAAGELNPGFLLYSFLFMLIVLFVGILMFNRVERSFMDTV